MNTKSSKLTAIDSNIPSAGEALFDGGSHAWIVDAPDSEVAGKKSRRRFTGKYKLRILHEAESCIASGQLGVLLRRERLFSSSAGMWSVG